MDLFSSHDPCTGETVWHGPVAGFPEIDVAVRRAQAAWPDWTARPLAEREAILRAFAALLRTRGGEIAEAISREVGKPPWEARAEVETMGTKIDFSIEAQARRCAEFRGGAAITRFRPHGVVAVLGPFNFPGHLPNGHIVPALLAGNAVVFKPSEFAPLVAERTLALWRAAGLPEQVLSIVQGGRETGAILAAHPGLNGLFFTGSARAGLALSEQFARTPERILALEMGGNNPLVAWRVRDPAAAALLAVQSAYLTAGQRCTCARRFILDQGPEGDAILEAFCGLLPRVRVGPPTDLPEPFCGPVISAEAADRLLAAQTDLLARGAIPLAPLRALRPGTGLLSPGLLDVTAVPSRPDEELFGPLLLVVRVPDFSAALAEANDTRYGLAAGLLSDDPDLWQRFQAGVRAGVVNWNRPLPGASGAVPFGGVGRSGNHRPSAFFAADYCSFPVASLETPELRLPECWPIGLSPGPRG